MEVSEDEGKTFVQGVVKESTLEYAEKTKKIQKLTLVILKQNTIQLEGGLLIKFRSIHDL